MCDNVMLIIYKVLLPYETVVILPISTIASAHMLLLLLLMVYPTKASPLLHFVLYLLCQLHFVAISQSLYTEIYETGSCKILVIHILVYVSSSMSHTYTCIYKYLCDI